MTALILLQPGVPCTTCALPAEILLGLGMGAVFVLAFSAATTGVNQREAGAASAMANTAQQTGAPVGTALHNAVAATATAADLAAHSAGPGGHSRETVQSALVHGYATAAGWAAAILVLAAITGRRLLKTRRSTPPAFPHTHPDRSRSTDSGTATARSTT